MRDSSIQLKAVPVKSLQKFAGKVISFSLAVPAAKLFCREVNYNIGRGLKSSKPVIMSDALKKELEHWKFLDSWSGFLSDIPRYVDQDHFQTKFDNKSGYDHILLTQESRKYFGLFWEGWFFVYNSLPFGWSPSSYVYHSVGLGPSHFIRTKRVPLSQYIDDRHIGQLRLPQGQPNIWSNMDLAKASFFIAALVLVSCGYFIRLKKSIFLPVQSLVFLGFLQIPLDKLLSP